MEDFHHILRRLNKSHRKAARHEFQKIGLTKGQPKVLDYLILNNGCIQKEIAKHCHIEPATVSSLLVNMEKKGLVRRASNSNNRRILNVFLTEKGFEAQKQVRKIFSDLEKQSFKGFTKEEKVEFFRLVEKIQDNLDERISQNDT